MSDLISRSKLLKEIKTWGGCVEALREYIQNMPTAYDVDKVVEELKKHKDTTDLTTVDEEMVVGFTIYQGAFNDAIDKAIEIVKHGGIRKDV